MVEKPKRPLSSFNLFNRYKRSLLAGQGEIPEDSIRSILTCPPGLEDELLQALSTQEQQHQLLFINSPSSLSAETNELRHRKIRTALEGKIIPSDTAVKRLHRKAADGLSLSFVEMGRLISESWKSVDPFAKEIFDKLAEEGRAFYRDALKEYNRVMNVQGEGGALERGEGEELEGIVILQEGGHQNSIKKNTATKNVTAHKVARNYKKKPSSMDASPPERSINDSDENLRLHMGSIEPPPVIFDARTEVDASMLYKPKKAHDLQRRHFCPNPEDISRFLASAGIEPMPLTTSSQAPSRVLASSQPWLSQPPTSFQPKTSSFEEDMNTSDVPYYRPTVNTSASARPRNYFRSRRDSTPLSLPMDTNQLLQSPTPRNCHVNLNSFVGASLKFSPMMTWTPRDKNDTQLPLVTPVSRCICIHNTHDAHLFSSHSDPALDLFRQQVEEKVDPFDNFHPIDQDIHDEYLSSFHPDPALDLFRQQVEEKVDPFDNFHPIDQDIHDEYLSSFHPDPALDLFRRQVEEKVNGFTFTRNNKARSIQVGDVIVDKPMDLFDEADSLEDYFDSDCEYSL